MVEFAPSREAPEGKKSAVGRLIRGVSRASILAICATLNGSSNWIPEEPQNTEETRKAELEKLLRGMNIFSKNCEFQDARIIGFGDAHNLHIDDDEYCKLIDMVLGKNDLLLVEGRAFDELLTKFDDSKVIHEKTSTLGTLRSSPTIRGWDDVALNKEARDLLAVRNDWTPLLKKSLDQSLSVEERKKVNAEIKKMEIEQEKRSNRIEQIHMERNKRMFESIATALKTHHRVFVLAGAAHFREYGFPGPMTQYPYVVIEHPKVTEIGDLIRQLKKK